MSSPIWGYQWSVPYSVHVGDSRPMFGLYGDEGSGIGDGYTMFAGHAYVVGLGHGETMSHTYGFVSGDGMSQQHD